MNRRTFLMNSLAVIGTGLFLPKKVEAFEERKLVVLGYAWGWYRAGYIKKRWISKEYLTENRYNIELEDGSSYKKFEPIKVKPNAMIFVDTKDGGKYMYRMSSYKGIFNCSLKRYFS